MFILREEGVKCGGWRCTEDLIFWQWRKISCGATFIPLFLITRRNQIRDSLQVMPHFFPPVYKRPVKTLKVKNRKELNPQLFQKLSSKIRLMMCYWWWGRRNHKYIIFNSFFFRYNYLSTVSRTSFPASGYYSVFLELILCNSVMSSSLLKHECNTDQTLT